MQKATSERREKMDWNTFPSPGAGRSFLLWLRYGLRMAQHLQLEDDEAETERETERERETEIQNDG